MTREEKSILYLKHMRKCLCEDHLNICPKDSNAYKATLIEKDFYDTAIEALEQEQTTKNDLGVDCISRKFMRDLGATCIAYRNNKQELIPIVSIDELPSVTPQEPKTEQFAKWVATEIFDDLWEYNKDSFVEIACRKLAELGIVRAKGDEWELIEPRESEDSEWEHDHELLKAYSDGANAMLDKIRKEILDTLYVDSLIFGELFDFRIGMISADDVIDEFNRVTRLEVLKILDKYKAEREG